MTERSQFWAWSRTGSRAWARSLADVSSWALVATLLWLTVPAPGPLLKTTQIALAVLAVIGVSVRARYPRTSLALTASATAVGAILSLTADPFLLASAAT